MLNQKIIENKLHQHNLLEKIKKEYVFGNSCDVDDDFEATLATPPYVWIWEEKTFWTTHDKGCSV